MVAIIKLVNKSDPQELNQALKFINGIARRLYNCEPPPEPQIIFSTRLNGEVTGTVSLDFSDEDDPLPIEKFWEFNKNQTPLPFKRQEVAQIGRWMRDQPGTSQVLVLAASFYSLLNGRKYFISEAKPRIIAFLESLGFVAYKINGAKLLLDKVPENGKPYYLHSETNLYMFDLRETLRSAVRNINAPISIELYPDIFSIKILPS